MWKGSDQETTWRTASVQQGVVNMQGCGKVVVRGLQDKALDQKPTEANSGYISVCEPVISSGRLLIQFPAASLADILPAFLLSFFLPSLAASSLTPHYKLQKISRVNAEKVRKITKGKYLPERMIVGLGNPTERLIYACECAMFRHGHAASLRVIYDVL